MPRIRLSTQGVLLLAGLALASTASLLVAAGWWAARDRDQRVAVAMTAGDPARAPDLIRRYGCAGCHTIGGIPGADGQVGGSLQGLRKRVYVAGVVTNAPEQLVRWIVRPQDFTPQTAMPASGISEQEARDVAAYLYAN